MRLINVLRHKFRTHNIEFIFRIGPVGITSADSEIVCQHGQTYVTLGTFGSNNRSTTNGGYSVTRG